jgi:DNA/RNA endonuclease G (NUC1)/PKD repeat protein
LNISGDPALNGKVGQIAVRDEANFNNYLIETPQSAISYSKDKGTANWVSYKLDRSWMNTTGLGKPNFVVDYSLPLETFDRNSNKALNGTPYSQGHIATASHRSRTIQSYYPDATGSNYAIKKDYYLDHLMTNLLPEIEIKIPGKNNPLQDFEEYLKNKLVGTYDFNTNSFDGAGKELYIISGGLGNKGQLIASSPTFSQLPVAYQEKMTVPEYLWKVVLVLDHGQDIRDVNSNTIAFAVKLPNDISMAGTSWTKYIESVSQLESETGYKFFANLPDNFQNSIKNNTSIISLPVPLMADDKNLSEFFREVVIVSSSQPRNSEQLTVGEIGLPQDNVGKIVSTTSKVGIDFGIPEISKSQISIEQSATQISPVQMRPSQISPFQISPTEVSILTIGSNQIGISQIGASQITTAQFSDSSTNQAGFSEIETTQVKIAKIKSDQISSGEIGLTTGNKRLDFSEGRSGGIVNIFPIFHLSDAPQILSNLQNTTIDIWSDLLKAKTPINFTFNITHLPTGQLAEGTITSYNTNGTPKTATITIDDDANGVGWFIDTTPQDNSEFRRGDGGTGGLGDYYITDPNSPASGKYDLLTAILHEMGHTLGIINGYSEFDQHIKNGIFTTDTFSTKLTPDGSHLDSTLYPYDLMNTNLKPGVRKLPSAMDWAIIDALNSGVGSGVSGVTVNPAHLTAGALIGITNGDFTISTTWNTAGATNIINGTATLTEQSQKLSELTQAFIIPTGAKTLQFTITDNHLIPGDTTKTANDAFEVALLDTNTFNPLAGTSIGLNHTDSLLNIQANGTIHKSDKVTITALANNSSIVTIDLTQVTPTTQATLYFNLLGFGARTSTITIDDVKLFTDTQPLPITKNDTLATTQNTPLTFTTTQLTTNDTNVTQIQILTQTTHGTLTQTPDGKITYQPIPTYVGNDSFTYLGYGSDGQISNLATVNLTVNNLPPAIQNVTIPTTINEGQTIQLSALAKDGGSSENLTYTWNLGDGSNPITGNNIAHTYTDNGNYQVTLTVTDFDGGTTNQTTTVKVDNLAPIVNLTTPTTTTSTGSGQALNQGESLNLGVTYSDPGIKDTHTITWNFGDGTTPITGVTNPNHTFLKAGTNNVTVTVTDNDGASTTKSLQIAVANLPPTINTLDIPTDINEGSTVQLTATATDPGNDSLIYNWYINGATTPIVGQTIDYQFADNGIYPVRLNVIDSNGAITTKSVDVTINNVAPVIISIVQPNQINEGQPVQFTATASDSGINDTLTYSWDSSLGIE